MFKFETKVVGDEPPDGEFYLDLGLKSQGQSGTKPCISMGIHIFDPGYRTKNFTFRYVPNNLTPRPRRGCFRARKIFQIMIYHEINSF